MKCCRTCSHWSSSAARPTHRFIKIKTRRRLCRSTSEPNAMKFTKPSNCCKYWESKITRDKLNEDSMLERTFERKGF